MSIAKECGSGVKVRARGSETARGAEWAAVAGGEGEDSVRRRVVECEGGLKRGWREWRGLLLDGAG